MEVVGVYKLSKGAKIPVYSTKKSACVDVSSCLDHVEAVETYTPNNSVKHVTVGLKKGKYIVNVPPWHRAKIPTGLSFDIPEGYSIRGHPRSGSSMKHGMGLVNSEAVIDEDYVWEMFVSVINLSDVPLQIEHGQRIVQAELYKDTVFDFLEYDEPPHKKTDRDGGYNSTGES